jgi:hypothetical protein
MPQFMPFHWSNLLSWFFVLITFMVALNHSIALPHILKLQLVRIKLLSFCPIDHISCIPIIAHVVLYWLVILILHKYKGVPKIVLLAFLYGSTTPLVAGAPFSAICFIVGSIGLSGQWQIGRFIAYSAIVHLGYFIMATTALLFYGFVYSLALLNLFLVISSISGYKDKIILLTITEGAGLTGIDGGLASR